jgi:hypothetical protein
MSDVIDNGHETLRFWRLAHALEIDATYRPGASTPSAGFHPIQSSESPSIRSTTPCSRRRCDPPRDAPSESR